MIKAKLLAKSAALFSYIAILIVIKLQPSRVDRGAIGFQDFYFSNIISIKTPLY